MKNKTKEEQQKLKENLMDTVLKSMGENKYYNVETLGNLNILAEGLCVPAKNQKEARELVWGIVENACRNALFSLGGWYSECKYQAYSDYVNGYDPKKKSRIKTKQYVKNGKQVRHLEDWVKDDIVIGQVDQNSMMPIPLSRNIPAIEVQEDDVCIEFMKRQKDLSSAVSDLKSPDEIAIKRYGDLIEEHGEPKMIEIEKISFDCEKIDWEEE